VWSSASGERAAQRQRDRGERGGKKVGVPGVGVPWGLAPTGGRRQQRPERGARGRRAPRARILAGQSGGERRLTGVPALEESRVAKPR
jgi:hypothetical protein